MKNLRCSVLLCLPAVLGLTMPVGASAKGKAVYEAAEYTARKFGKEAAEEGVDTLTRKIEVLAARHGDEGIVAVRKVGPRAFHLVEQAGEHGPKAVKLMARFGDDAVWIISRPKGMAVFVKYGDDAAEAILRHKEIAEPLIEAHGVPAVKALKSVLPQNGRRISMMHADGELAKMGRTSALLEVVGKYGDRAMDFLWKHKGALAVSAALAAFLADPMPFIDGTRNIAEGEVQKRFDEIVAPVARTPGKVEEEPAQQTSWTLVGLAAIGVLTVIVYRQIWFHRR